MVENLDEEESDPREPALGIESMLTENISRQSIVQFLVIRSNIVDDFIGRQANVFVLLRGFV